MCAAGGSGVGGEQVMSALQNKDEPYWWLNHPWMDRHLFMENRNRNCHLLLHYDNMLVAWFPDGSGIRDADVDGYELWKRIKASGDDPSWFVYEYFSTIPEVGGIWGE
jgi:hypothetical protein